ncbi:MAG: hypothetical protein RMJ59_06560 [Candidatus Nitrosocaldus sp.]|nr:hypothetical protein [Candidatus Nitrosocaldus sp.]MCS7140594.1 hypothetical protein [Candidatus Nitrosocaldus sp.]MDW7999592.1 hypothetical protein [Candidatus Nitrosocaldus sp.]MDW8276021.1 hypothetical protein [Candidatus Nitrosocaldus sp.]
MVWVYVVVGLLIILVLVVLLKGERRSTTHSRGHGQYHDMSGTLTICLSCGSRFRGSKCPYCGFEHAEHRL